jgi:hypothetical protein
VLGYGVNKLYEPTVEQVYLYLVKQEGKVGKRAFFENIIGSQEVLEDLHPDLYPLYDGSDVTELRYSWEDTLQAMKKKVPK